MKRRHFIVGMVASAATGVGFGVVRSCGGGSTHDSTGKKQREGDEKGTPGPSGTPRVSDGPSSAATSIETPTATTTSTKTAAVDPLVLVYQGPAAYSTCSQATAEMLSQGPGRLRVKTCGPDGEYGLDESALARAKVYVQPGGSSLQPAWRQMSKYRGLIRDFVNAGGVYLGICLGAYLAGDYQGFALLPGRAVRYIETRGAAVGDGDDAVVPVNWRGKPYQMYFQDGAAFQQPTGTANVLATYTNGEAAAVVASFGKGAVGVVGPHPEANQYWFRGEGLPVPDPLPTTLGHDLTTTAMAASSRVTSAR